MTVQGCSIFVSKTSGVTLSGSSVNAASLKSKDQRLRLTLGISETTWNVRFSVVVIILLSNCYLFPIMVYSVVVTCRMVPTSGASKSLCNVNFLDLDVRKVGNYWIIYPLLTL